MTKLEIEWLFDLIHSASSPHGLTKLEIECLFDLIHSACGKLLAQMCVAMWHTDFAYALKVCLLTWETFLCITTQIRSMVWFCKLFSESMFVNMGNLIYLP